MGEFRTARNGNASPNGLRNPADVRSVGQIARKTELERANEYKPFESRASIEEIARRHSPTHGLEGHFGVGKKRLRLQARVGEPPQGLSKLRASFRRRRPDAPLFNDHRRHHAGPVAIVTERLEKFPVALVLRILEATTDPDLGVIVRALRLITLGPHRPQMPFDERAIRNRYPATLRVGRSRRHGLRPAYVDPVRICLLVGRAVHNRCLVHSTRTQWEQRPLLKINFRSRQAKSTSKSGTDPCCSIAAPCYCELIPCFVS